VLQVWHTDDRARIEAYTHWGIIGFAGLLVRTYSLSAACLASITTQSQDAFVHARLLTPAAKFPDSHCNSQVIDRLDAEHLCVFAGADCAVEQFCFHAGAACHHRSHAGSSSFCSQ